MDDKIPFYLRKIGETIEGRLGEAVDKKRQSERTESGPPAPRGDRSDERMDFIEPDWDELDRKADMIVARYAVVSAIWNVLPTPLDVMGVAATFSKMTTELAGVYQVIVSSKRSREMGWAIATTTASVLGIAYAGSRLMKYLPGGYLASLLVQAPIVGAVAWAAGDALKDYFKQTRKGVEPGINSLRDSFAQTLHIKLRSAKPTIKLDDATPAPGTTTTPPPSPTVAPTAEAAPPPMEQIIILHELLKAGAITQAEFDAKKTDLLTRV